MYISGANYVHFTVGPNMYILGAYKYILGVNMYILGANTFISVKM